jgi:hypothetical protein
MRMVFREQEVVSNVVQHAVGIRKEPAKRLSIPEQISRWPLADYPVNCKLYFNFTAWRVSLEGVGPMNPMSGRPSK